MPTDAETLGWGEGESSTRLHAPARLRLKPFACGLGSKALNHPQKRGNTMSVQNHNLKVDRFQGVRSVFLR